MPPKPRLPSPRRIRTPSPPRAPPSAPPRQDNHDNIVTPKGLGGKLYDKVKEPIKEHIKDKNYTPVDLLDRSGI